MFIMWIKQRIEKNKGMRSGNTGWRSRNEIQEEDSKQKQKNSRRSIEESQWVNGTQEARQWDKRRFWGEEVVMKGSRRAV